MKTEAKIGVMQPEAKGPQGPPEAERGQEDSPLDLLGGAWLC